ncbi:hypothetical protein MmiHf6_05760 [Methanimicrococcus hongohii]|uniref:Nickel transport protein n=1 Tax=Methanimicrococcus hongohii TaxID=3028295 RepID=A0AA96ZTI8_9EURY|nr:hypothetical protein [Methanimicrococcus sp. Hf6]WNY23271.1 hypothetical protein MmiHf6_05760 [Methanimicrococcus sp. Hf6]
MTYKILKYMTAALLILSLFVAPAAAHGVYMSWNLQGDTVSIHAYYQGNDPMANTNVTIEAIDAAGTSTIYVTGLTDANGNYSFAVKEGITSYRIKVVEGEHAINKKIDIGTGTSGAESSGGWWSKIVGTEGPSLFTVGAGLGWIVGIAGIILYLQARRELKKKNS